MGKKKHFDGLCRIVLSCVFKRVCEWMLPSTFTGCKTNLKMPIILDKMIKIQAIDKICLYVPFKINLLSAKRMRQTMPTWSVQDSGVLLYSMWGR